MIYCTGIHLLSAATLSYKWDHLSQQFTSVFRDTGFAISIAGRGRCMDNLFSQRLTPTLKVRHTLHSGPMDAETYEREMLPLMHRKRRSPNASGAGKYRDSTTTCHAGPWRHVRLHPNKPQLRPQALLQTRTTFHFNRAPQRT